LPNLEELWALVLFEDLPRLKEIPPKLENLILTMDGLPVIGQREAGHTSCNIDTLFNGFQIFAGTLKELDILVNHVVTFILPNSADYRLDFPKLERLALAYSPMNPLLSLSSMKRLK